MDLSYLSLILMLNPYIVIGNEETVNTCVAHSLSDDMLKLLSDASFQILDVDTEEFKTILREIQDKLDKLNGSLSSLNKTSVYEITTKSLNDILQFQKSFSEMLNSVFNTVLNNNNVIEDMNTAFSHNFVKLGERITELMNKEEGTKEVPHVESILPEALNITHDERGSCSEDSHLELMKNQNETNELLTKLLEEALGLKTLQNEYETLTKENQILKKQLDKSKGNMRPSDCSDILVSGLRKSGIYEIYPSRCDCGPPLRVWCDMETEGGGWTVLLPRTQNKKMENFTRSWSDYEKGFGHPESEYWIGLQNLYKLTAHRRFSLRLEVTSRSNRRKWAQWNSFEVASPKEKYKLAIGEFDLSSTLGDVLRSHNNQHFSTFDSDNDSSYDKNCADLLQGGWWYGKCYDIHPTGTFDASDIRMGVSTALFSHSEKNLISLKKVLFKIKPLECVLQSSISYLAKSCDIN